jgi:hypothetical protein
MKNFILTIAILFSATIYTGAQINKPVQNRLESYRVAFFTERLQLTPDESKGFWPLYNEFEEEQRNLRNKYDLQDKKLELLADSEIESFIMKSLDVEEQIVKIRRNYIKRFMQVLPVRKVAMLQRIENDFRRALLEELRNRRMPQGGGLKNQGNRGK